MNGWNNPFMPQMPANMVYSPAPSVIQMVGLTMLAPILSVGATIICNRAY